MQNELHNKYNLEKIQFLMNNKSKITEDILQELRSYGLAGKQIALDVLELKQYETIQDIHYIEMEKCKNDVIYFKDNYLLILNKDELQDKMLEGIKIYNKIHLTSARQSKRTYAACIYALWLFNFYEKKTIGIASYKSTWSKEMISHITNLHNYIPTWMKIKSRNLKTTMTSEMKTQIVTDLVDGNAFRGRTLDLLIVDCLEATKAQKFNEFKEFVTPKLIFKKAKVIFIGANPYINVNADIEINEYTELPITLERPVLKRTFKQIIKDYILSLYIKIKG